MPRKPHVEQLSMMFDEPAKPATIEEAISEKQDQIQKKIAKFTIPKFCDAWIAPGDKLWTYALHYLGRVFAVGTGTPEDDGEGSMSAAYRCLREKASSLGTEAVNIQTLNMRCNSLRNYNPADMCASSMPHPPQAKQVPKSKEPSP